MLLSIVPGAREAATDPFKPVPLLSGSVHGTLTTGAGDAAGFVAAVDDALAATLGFDPFHGTLNLETGTETMRPEPTASLDGVGDDHCDGVDLTPCRVAGVRAALLRPLVPGYPEDKVEVVAPVRLQSVLRVEPGDRVELAFGDAGTSPDPAVDPAALDAFDAVVAGSADAADVLEAVDVPVGARVDRDDPSRDALTERFDRLDATPGNGVYVGATDGDAAAAVEVGTSFLHVDQLSAAR